VRGAVAEAQSTRRTPRALLAIGARKLLVPPGGGVIGRSRECEIVLDDAGISRRHAELRPQGGAWTIEDLGSTNGVLVNGTPVRGAQPLSPGDRVELGSTEIVFEVG
jgi:predicted component of type VI protein secretion system